MKKLIIIEGIDGSGKSSVVASLKERYDNVHFSVEPSKKYREKIFKAIEDGVDYSEQCKILSESRKNSINEFMDKDVVISDRWLPSTIGYQLSDKPKDAVDESILGSGLDVLRDNGWEVHYIYLKIDASTSIARVIGRGNLDIMDAKPKSEKIKIINSYEAYFKAIEAFNMKGFPNFGIPTYVHTIQANTPLAEVIYLVSECIESIIL